MPIRPAISLKEYTQRIVKVSPECKVTWLTAQELLDILNRLEVAENAQSRLAMIEAEEAEECSPESCSCLDAPDAGDVYEPGGMDQYGSLQE